MPIVTKDMRNHAIKMVERRFEPLLDRAKQVSDQFRDKVRAQVESEWQLPEYENRLTSAEARVDEIKKQMEDIFGDYSKYNHGYKKLEAEVERRLKTQDGIYGKLLKVQQDVIDKIWVSDFPESIRAIIDEIGDQLKPLDKEVKQIEQKGN